jgi:hypothetical protein
MRRARASIAMLLVYIALFAVGLAALRVSSRLWANVGFSLAITLLLAAVAGLIYLRGESRAFALGFALFGWPYLLITFGPTPFGNWRDLLVTKPALAILEEYLKDAAPPVTPPPVTPPRPLGPGAARMSGTRFVELTPWTHWTAPDRSNPFASDSFDRIGHSFFCIAIATAGGGFCRFLYHSRDESSPSP